MRQAGIRNTVMLRLLRREIGEGETGLKNVRVRHLCGSRRNEERLLLSRHKGSERPRGRDDLHFISGPRTCASSGVWPEQGKATPDLST